MVGHGGQVHVIEGEFADLHARVMAENAVLVEQRAVFIGQAVIDRGVLGDRRRGKCAQAKHGQPQWRHLLP